MFQNARVYNAKGSDIYVMAGHLQKYSLKELENALTSEEQPPKGTIFNIITLKICVGKSDRKKRTISKSKRLDEVILFFFGQILL